MKKLFALLLSGLLIQSCIVDGHSDIRTKLVDATNHTIQIVPYHNGNEVLSGIVTIDPQKITEVAIWRGIGKVNPQSYSYELQYCDSVKLLFEDQKKIVYLNSGINNAKGINYSNVRNIINPNNYIKVIKVETTHSIAGYFSYTFIEQDYIDASQ